MLFRSINTKTEQPYRGIRKSFKTALKQVGIENFGFHDLRHTFASFLIAQNMPLKYVQAQMGHESIQTTSDRYGHLMPEVEQVGRNAFDKIKI